MRIARGSQQLRRARRPFEIGWGLHVRVDPDQVNNAVFVEQDSAPVHQFLSREPDGDQLRS